MLDHKAKQVWLHHLEYNAVNEKIALDDIKISSQSLFYELIVFCLFQLKI